MAQKVMPIKAKSPCTSLCCSVLDRHYCCPITDRDCHAVQHTTVFLIQEFESPCCTLLVASHPCSGAHSPPLLPRLFACPLSKNERCSRMDILQYYALTISSAHWYQQYFAAFCYILPLYRRTSCSASINNRLTIP